MLSVTSPTGRLSTRPAALVYRGPAGCPGCSEAVAALLQRSKWRFDVTYVGPNETLQLSAATLQSAALFAQPGGAKRVLIFTPTSSESVSSKPTSAEPTSALPTWAKPTSAEPTSVEPISTELSLALPTSAEPTSALPTSAGLR